jgi:ADP-heptose:LPS heptosyltransferase
LIDKICAHTGWTAALCGSRAEYQLCAGIGALTSRRVINLAGKSSLSELVEIIRMAELLVGNETSAIHISSAVGTPSICLLGGGHFGRFVPYEFDDGQSGVAPVPAFHKMDCFGCNWQCTQRYAPGDAVPCIAGIEVEQVLAKVRTRLITKKIIK